MSLTLDDSPALAVAPDAMAGQAAAAPKVLAFAAWHSLFWLVFANAIGALLAALLLFPRLNGLLGEATYGRWMPAHINLQLYGWCSLPLVGFLFRAYGADRAPTAQWCRPILWMWSCALAVGAFCWLGGHSSGKLFLDWTGYSRALFPLAQAALWLLLAVALARSWGSAENASLAAKAIKLGGLIFLLLVPVAIYLASAPNLYPPINPDTGGPTGASQLESVLVVVAILLLLPWGIAKRARRASWPNRVAWGVFAAEFLLCLALGRGDVSHHRPVQYISLGSLLIWLPIMPAYYGGFAWHENTRRWRVAFLCWWSVLVPTGWCLFLPGVLDHFKFTDGLVAHSLLAMAGFVSSVLIFAMVQLLGEDGRIFNGGWSFYVWQGAVLAYIAAMFAAGWREGYDPAFAIVPGGLRDGLYGLRLLLGLLMLAASADWLVDATKLLGETSGGKEFAR
jgi:cytochrome c oxidase cbb3-type subunit 1